MDLEGSTGDQQRAPKSDGCSYWEKIMTYGRCKFAAIIGLVLALAFANPANAQKTGGVLKIYFFDSPATMSIHEEATYASLGPMMGVFNNLIHYCPVNS